MERRIIYRYSEAFKHQVLDEIQKGRYTIQEARRVYGINGAGTIQGWAKKMGKLDVIPKVIRVEKPDEKSRMKALEAENRKLKEALANAHLDKIIAEGYLEAVCDQTGLDIETVKKKLGVYQPKKL